MTDLRGPSVLEELLALWKLATAAERVAFLSHVVSPANRAEPVPMDAGEPGR